MIIWANINDLDGGCQEIQVHIREAMISSTYRSVELEKNRLWIVWGFGNLRRGAIWAGVILAGCF